MKRFAAFLLAFLQILPHSLNAQPLAALPAGCRLGSIFEGARCRIPTQDDPVCKQNGCRDWQRHSQADQKSKEKIQNPVPKPEEKKSNTLWHGMGRFLGGILRALLNLFKLAIFAPLSIASNLVEGIVDGIGDIFRGDILGAITWPAKVALNAAWNTFMTGANAVNVASDPLWRMIQPEQDEDISVDLVGAGNKMRTQITGGPWSYLHKICQEDAVAYVLSSAFIQSHKRYLAPETLAHEFVHTQQVQDGFLLNTALRRLEEGNTNAGAVIENGVLIHQPLFKVTKHPDKSVEIHVRQYVKEGQNLGKVGPNERRWIDGTIEAEADFKGKDLENSLWMFGQPAYPNSLPTKK